MQFNKHSEFEGKHAFLSPSKYHWINYDDEKIDAKFLVHMTAARGTRLHEFAQMAIELGQKMPKSKKTLNMYVNDAIGWRMTPELTLVYSENAFGHCDAISFRKNKLRIHDLKNGVSPTSEKQLFVYEALFCLEYGFEPWEIEAELRIYQNDEIRAYIPEPDEIKRIMNRIVTADQRVREMKKEAFA